MVVGALALAGTHCLAAFEGIILCSGEDPRQVLPLIMHPFDSLHVLDIDLATQPDSSFPPLRPARIQEHSSAGPIYTLAADMMPALDEVALTSRKRKRGSNAHRAHDATHCGAHRDPPSFVVQADVSAPSFDVSAATLKVAASMYPLHAKVAKENAEHFMTQGLRHLSSLIPWSDYPLHLYVHCEHISPVPALYVRSISGLSLDLDEDVDMDLEDGLTVAHLHVGGAEDRDGRGRHSEVNLWCRFTFSAPDGEVRMAKVMATRLVSSAFTCTDYDSLCNPVAVGSSDDPGLSIGDFAYRPRWKDPQELVDFKHGGRGRGYDFATTEATEEVG
ncbi:hypothetical protein OH76DRAFT_1488354 [Lentinus brumalis]|uniref:Uncharacterized protein n=1 Tax=Lentinus brumalis TaxID=2498619 RepID=A0A371CRD7_9APHY|nr:hypothetical protein OH76DRAFT_1488354 [Polyporus brumalis]